MDVTSSEKFLQLQLDKRSPNGFIILDLVGTKSNGECPYKRYPEKTEDKTQGGSNVTMETERKDM